MHSIYSFMGQGITVVTSGNVLQAGFQYGANTAIKNETGKDALSHLKMLFILKIKNKFLIKNNKLI